MTKPSDYKLLNEVEQAAIDSLLTGNTQNGADKTEKRDIYAKAYRSGMGDLHDVIRAEIEQFISRYHRALSYQSLGENERIAVDEAVKPKNPDQPTALEQTRRNFVAQAYKSGEGHIYELIKASVEALEKGDRKAI